MCIFVKYFCRFTNVYYCGLLVFIITDSVAKKQTFVAYFLKTDINMINI